MHFVRAVDAGISIMMEVGLDPGIDHMLAMECFKDIKDRNGEVKLMQLNYKLLSFMLKSRSLLLSA